jgi:hypothetical protein
LFDFIAFRRSRSSFLRNCLGFSRFSLGHGVQGAVSSDFTSLMGSTIAFPA